MARGACALLGHKKVVRKVSTSSMFRVGRKKVLMCTRCGRVF